MWIKLITLLHALNLHHFWVVLIGQKMILSKSKLLHTGFSEWDLSSCIFSEHKNTLTRPFRYNLKIDLWKTCLQLTLLHNYSIPIELFHFISKFYQLCIEEERLFHDCWLNILRIIFKQHKYLINPSTIAN